MSEREFEAMMERAYAELTGRDSGPIGYFWPSFKKDLCRAFRIATGRPDPEKE